MSVGPRRHLSRTSVAAVAAVATGAFVLAVPAQAAPAAVPVTALAPLPSATYISAASEAAAYLTFYEGAAASAVLWKSNGTASGTAKVANLPRSIRSNDEYGGPFFAVAGTRAFFVTGDATSGDELWTSDGTSGGTKAVKDLRPGTNGSQPQWLTVVGSKVFFTADDDDGRELWVSDGSAEGTTKLPKTDAGCGSLAPENLTPGNDKLWFTRYDADCAQQLWLTDGTVAGSKQVTDFSQGDSGAVYGIGVDGERAFFSLMTGTYGSEQYDLYVTDGSLLGADNLTNGSLDSLQVNESGDYGFPGYSAVLAGKYYFMAGDGSAGVELWRSDGTDAGTGLFADLKSGAGGSYPQDLAVVGSRLFLSASGDAGYGYATDGTVGGTVPLPAAADNWVNGVVAGSTLYFPGSDGVHGEELWQTDGTVDGTGMVAEIRAGSADAGFAFGSMTASGSVLYFIAGSANGMGRTWWRTGSGGDGPPVEDAVGNSVAPTLTGTAQVGKSVTVKPGTWTPSGVTLKYQWFRMVGATKTKLAATGTTYAPTAADLGRVLRVEVTGTKESSSRTVAAVTKAVKAGVLTVTKKPAISGKAKVKKKLTVRAGTTSPVATTSYQWLRSGKSIKGATASTYKLVKADKGRKVSVRVTWKKPGYGTVAVVSTSTATVKK